MDIESRNAVLQVQLNKKARLLRSARRLRLLAIVLVFATIAVAYASPTVPTTVFISLFPFLLVQVFATRDYAQLVRITRCISLLLGGPYFSTKHKFSWTVPAGIAVREGFFLLLFIFDVSWLAHAYLYPAPAASFQVFLQQLAMGPISGAAFVVFTVFLWAFYAWLFVVGSLYAAETTATSKDVEALLREKEGRELREFWMKVETADGSEIFLQSHRLANVNGQPLILWPGFFQNAFVYHLSEEASLARYLHQKGFDVWMVHPRGTALSDGRDRQASLDDFAGNDIPAAIDYVLSVTGKEPVFVGHSQGGISALISTMGASKSSNASVVLSDEEASKCQSRLKGLVVLGSFPDLSFSKPSWLQNFVREGLCISVGKRKWRIVSSQKLLRLFGKLAFVSTPVSFLLRQAILQSKTLRIALFPLVGIFNFLATRKLWEFLYHRPNLTTEARQQLFYKTMDGTFVGILKQYHAAVENEQMNSTDGTVNYSANYSRVNLPVSVVVMEYDSLADPVMTKEKMFEALGSKEKFFTLWQGVGHEDHFTNATYFPQVLEAIKKVC